MVTLVNRCKVSIATTGTGTVTLGATATGYQSFSEAGVANGDTVRYVIEDGSDWEIGTGTYNATTGTLTRTVSESSNSNAAISLSGEAILFLSAAAEDLATSGHNHDSDYVNVTGDTMSGTLSATALIGTAQDASAPSADDAKLDGFGVQGNRSGNPVYLHNHGNGGVRISSNTSLGTVNGVLVTDAGINVAGNITVSGTVDGRDLNTDGTKLDGIESGATADQTAAEILAAIKTVDGGGSGLDADTLDGLQSSSFLRSDADNTATGKIVLGTAISAGSSAKLQIGGFQRTGPIMLAAGNTSITTFDTTNERWIMNDGSHIYASTSPTAYNNKIWTDGNDGSGSGLDADLLDGQQGSYYLDYTNLTNKPTIPSLSGYATETYVNTAVSNLVDSSPTTLDTLNELAAALGDDPNFATTVSNSIGGKVSKSGDTMSGNLQFSDDNEGIKFYSDNYLRKLVGTGMVLTVDSSRAMAELLQFERGSGGTKYSAFHDGYHPNADKWTTARTITLAGDLSGSVSIDGSANVTLTAAVSDDSHYHSQSRIYDNRAAGDVTPDGLPSKAVFYTFTDDLPNTGNTWDSVLNVKGWDDGYRAWQLASNSGNADGNTGLYFRSGEDTTWGTMERVFTSEYHPNADKWTTARTNTVTLTGDVTGSGSASVDGSGDWTVSLSTAVSNDSHDHTRLLERSSITYGAGQLQWTDISGQNGTGLNGSTPTNPTNDWYHHIVMNHANNGGYYVDLAACFHHDGLYMRRLANGSLSSWNRFFADNYHPNADKWTTARTLSLSGDASGSVSWDGSADATLSVTVADDSHNHTWDNIDGASIGGLTGPRFTTSSGYIEFGPANTSWAHIYTDRPNFYFNKELYVNNSKVWNAGNDGSGSGLDADTVDGIHASSFIRSDADDTFTGKLTGSSTSISLGYDVGTTLNTIGASNWFRSSGATGWYNASYGGGIYMNDTTWVRVYNSKSFWSAGTIQSDSNVRAPIFYDTNDTAYYVDPNSTSNINNVKVNNTLYHSKIYRPDAVWGAAGSTTGAVLIRLPGTSSQYDMASIEIEVYEYNATAGSKIYISGHNWTTGWYQTSVRVVGDYNKPIYLGRDASYYYIQLGDTTSGWTYGSVHVTKATTAAYYTAQDWVTGWNISQSTTAPTYTHVSGNNNTASSETLATSGYLYAAASVRSPVFYDSDNTNYYVNPASTSRMNRIDPDEIYNYGWFRNHQVNEGLYNQATNSHFYSAGANYWHINNDSGTATSGGLVFYSAYNSTGQANATNRKGAIYYDTSSFGLLSPDNSWGVRVDDGKTEIYHRLDTPIVYDSDDTSYYVNPASTSNFNAVNIGGNTAWHAGNDGPGSGLDADTLDGVQGSSYLRSDAADNFTTLSGTQLNLGSEIQLSESTDRADLLQISSTTSGWGGLQIRNSSNEGRWSFMTDGATAGIYDDENGDWHIQMTENSGVSLYHNSLISLQTLGATGIRVGSTTSSDIYMQDTDHGERRIHCNSNRLGFLNSSSGWSFWSDDAGDIESVGGANFGNGTLTADGQNDVFMFATSATSGTAQAGAFHNKLRILGGSSQTRDLQLYQVDSEYAHIGSSWTSNQLTIDSAFTQVNFNQNVYAPVFFDKDNTAYFADPASTSVFNTHRVESTLYVGGGTTHGYINGYGTTAMSLHKVRDISFDYGSNWDNSSYHGIATTGASGSNADSLSINSYNDVTIRLDSNSNNADSYLRVYANTTTNVGGTIAFWTGAVGTSPQTQVYGNLGVNTGPRTDTYRLNMGGHIHMNNNNIDYVNQLHFNDNVRFYDDGNDNYLNFKWGDAGAGGIRFYDGDGTQHGYIYGDGSGSFGILDNDGGWGVRMQTGTNPMILHCDANPEFYVYTSYTYSPGSSRAPIFYDSNNTAYYANPNGTSRFATVDADYLKGDGSQITNLPAGSPFGPQATGSVSITSITDNGTNHTVYGPFTTDRYVSMSGSFYGAYSWQTSDRWGLKIYSATQSVADAAWIAEVSGSASGVTSWTDSSVIGSTNLNTGQAGTNGIFYGFSTLNRAYAWLSFSVKLFLPAGAEVRHVGEWSTGVPYGWNVTGSYWDA